MIARNYLSGWFTIDVLSIAVSAGDVVKLSMDSASGSSSTIMILKLLRVLRLIKMVRLLRASRIWKRWETRHAVNYRMLSLSTCILGIFLSAHWIACIWSLQTVFKGRRDESWLGRGSIEYCSSNAETDIVECVDPCIIFVAAMHFAHTYIHTYIHTHIHTCMHACTYGRCVDPGVVYVAAMHFAVMTITSIGYGDIVPTDTSEQVWHSYTHTYIPDGRRWYSVGLILHLTSRILHLTPQVVGLFLMVVAGIQWASAIGT